MKMKNFKRVLGLVLAAAMVLTACGQKPAANEKTSEAVSKTETSVSETESKETESVAATEETVVNKEDLPVISLYPANASLYSGEVTGYRSDYFAEHGFQMEVWAFSAEKSNAMMVSGDLPDIMYVQAGSDMFKTLVENEQIINYDDYKEYLPNIYENQPNEYWPANLEFSRESLSEGTGNLYILPSGLGTGTTKWRETSTFDRNIVKLRWDVYEAIGAPEISDLWELIDVMEDMMEYMPETEDGTKMYGTFLDNGMDTNYFGAMQLWYRWDGYDHNIYKYFIEGKHTTGEINSIFTEDSKYYEGLKWYNEVYRRGLMDPDSISTPRTDQAPKLTAGLAMVPAGTLPGGPPYCYEYFIPGLDLYYDFTVENMAANSTSLVINAETEYLEECLEFVNMLADPYSVLNIMYGPEGDIWQMDGNVVSCTDEFLAWLEKNSVINNYPMSDGTEWYTWNTPLLCSMANELTGYVGVDGKEVCCMPYLWSDAQAVTTGEPNWQSWKETMGADNLLDYVEKNNITLTTSSAFDGLVLPNPDDNQNLTISSIKDVVVTQSWQCVYAETDEEFDAAWDKMVKDAMGLGAQDIIDWRIQCYKDAMASRDAK